MSNQAQQNMFENQQKTNTSAERVSESGITRTCDAVREAFGVLENFKLSELFVYKDGHIYWKERPISHFVTEGAFKTFNSRFCGTIAGTITRSNGYREVRINNRAFQVHRVIFLMFYGWLPEAVDHIDRDINNNCIENLRAATKSQNGANSKMRINNNSGVKGVYFCKTSQKWVARMRVNKRTINLGSFNSIEDAEKARNLAFEAHFKEFACHG